MKPYWSNENATLWQGHVLDALAAMIEKSVHMVATSPPYYSLRDYGLEGVEWPAVSYAPMAGSPEIEIPGCDPECGHVWGEMLPVAKQSHTGEGGKHGAFHGGTDPREYRSDNTGQYCQLCGGWRGCLGLEPTVEMFVGHIVLVWRALWRVLRDDGVCWLNLGDSMSKGGGNRNNGSQGATSQVAHGSPKACPDQRAGSNLPAKNLLGVPWRVAFALQADGWYLRSSIIWAKGVSFCPTYSGSCMPGSQKDRPTSSYENVFLLAKKERYFYDHVAVREASAGITGGRQYTVAKGEQAARNKAGTGSAQDGSTIDTWKDNGTRNLRSVWTINPGSYAGAHFATFPPKLVEPMIKAGTSAKGCCPECGASWVRVTERVQIMRPRPDGDTRERNRGGRTDGFTKMPNGVAGTDITTTGWAPTCTCGTEHPIPQEELDADPTLLDDFEIEPFEPVPCTVLDIFAGSGTTLAEAIKLGRHSVGIELSKPYCDDHIIPRLSEPLFEWAEQERAEVEPEPVPVQGVLL